MLNHAKINDWLTVGNAHACGVVPAEIVVHIYRSDYPDHSCDYSRNLRPLRPLDVTLNYLDGVLLEEGHLAHLAPTIEQLRKKLVLTLVHCHSGTCRSPTVAAYLWAMVEDIHPLDAFARVERAIYDQRGALCNLVYQPRKQIVNLVQAERKK